MPRLAIGLAIAFVLVVGVCHVLRPDVDPFARGVSRYAVGPYGEVVNAAFLVLTAALVVTGLAFRRAMPDTGMAGVYLLWLGAAGTLIAAAFPLRAVDSMATANLPHQMGGVILFPAVAAGAVLLARATGRHEVLAWTVVAAGIVFCLSVAVPPLAGIRGLLQRVCFAAIVAWLVAANASLQLDDLVKRP